MQEATDGVQHLSLLASALARRPLQVGKVAPGELAWTDGKTLFIDVQQSAQAQLEALSVQAALLAAGSFEPEVLRRLTRRPGLARRYLSLEGQRALSALAPLLPGPLRGLLCPELARRSSSPSGSLAIARSRERLPDPPACFGTIRPQRLLAAQRDAARTQTAGLHVPRAQTAPLTELPEEDDGPEGLDDASVNAVGGGGPIGRWLSKLLSSTRRGRSAGGSPGADAPTHWTRAGTRGKGAVLSTASVPTHVDARAIDPAAGLLYPEWDVHSRSYRRDFCRVLETEPSAVGEVPGELPGRGGLRRSLARIALGTGRRDRQKQGDDLCVDALVQARVELLSGSTPNEAIFIESVRQRQNLAVLLLLDISGSAGEPGANGQTVHSQQRAAAAALTLALHELGDRVALYAYNSQGRTSVQLMPIKRFAEAPGAHVLQRLYGLVPGAYSRLGAAIRRGTSLLKTHAGTPHQLLVVLSDGLAYDHGYEPVYGAADARKALEEARSQGVGCLCLSVGAGTDAETLQRVFGASAHASLPASDQLQHVIGPLFRSAMRSADIKRRVS